jgi:hypothetical protein
LISKNRGQILVQDKNGCLKSVKHSKEVGLSFRYGGLRIKDRVDDLEVRDNLTVLTWPIRIEDRLVKNLRGNEIVLLKVI